MPDEEDPKPVRLGRAALEHPAADYADDWEMVCQCAGTCKHQQRPMAEIVPRLAPGMTLGALVSRLRCRQCSAPMEIVGLSRLSLLGHPPEWLLLLGAKGADWRDRARSR